MSHGCSGFANHFVRLDFSETSRVLVVRTRKSFPKINQGFMMSRYAYMLMIVGGLYLAELGICGCHFAAHYATAKRFHRPHTDHRAILESLQREVLQRIMTTEQVCEPHNGRRVGQTSPICTVISRTAEKLCDRISSFGASFLGFYNPAAFRYLDPMDHF